jgi:double-stranded uracil-DNA glycosylase
MLPDYLAPGLRVVFCGTAAGEQSTVVGHYYSGPGNEFWRFLHLAGFTPRQLPPAEDVTLTRYGVGLTDLAKQVAASNDRGLSDHYDVDGFVDKIRGCRPGWLAFHGKTAARVASSALGHGRDVALGEQLWGIAGTRVFVVPNASGANRDPSRLEGKRDRVEWFAKLHRVAFAR